MKLSDRFIVIGLSILAAFFALMLVLWSQILLLPALIAVIPFIFGQSLGAIIAAILPLAYLIFGIWFVFYAAYIVYTKVSGQAPIDTTSLPKPH
jgi:hypothetical protein